MRKPISFMRSLYSGLLAGFWGGQAFLAVGLARYADELFALSHPGFLTTWILIRSVALYGLLGAVAGILLAALLHVVFAGIGRGKDLAFPAVFGLSVAATAVAYLTAWRQIEVYVGLPFSYPGRMRSFSLDVLTSLVLGALSLLVIVWLRRKLARPERPDAAPRFAWTVLILCIVGVLASDYALRLKEPLVDSPAGARRLLVLGVDAGSLRVMGPMMRAGELPTFAKFVDEGAWGTFLAYGTAFSPIQWTSMATGKKVEDHGIYDFVAPKEGTSEARLLTSRDRKVEAVWHMVGQQGFRVGVIDWLMTHPPEEVNGYMISRLHTAASSRAYPEALEPAVELAKADREEFGDRARNRLLGEIDLLFKLAARLGEIDPVDVQIMFEAATDEAGHNFWKYYEPDRFDPDLWEISPQDIDKYASLIPDTYRLIDRRLGELLDTLSDDTLVLVVSDHGQRASLGASMWFGVDQVLAQMGELQFAHPTSTEGEETWLPEVALQGQDVDFETSRAYSALAVAGSTIMGVKVNLEGREPTGTMKPDEADAFIEELAARLRSIAFENGDPLFGLVSSKSIDDDSGGAAAVDITIQHSEFTRGASALDAARSGRKVIIDGQTLPLSRFIATDVGVSGRHERSGVIFVAGKGVRRGFIGQTVATTAIQALFRHLTDKLSVADTALPVLRRLGMIDRATTLDVTPTILYALGAPIGEDMAGRALTDVIVAPAPRWIASYDDPNRVTEPVGEGEADEEVLKRLRALGYIR